MLVLAAVPQTLNQRLGAAVSEPFKLVAVESWEDAVSTILREPVEIAVLDPALEGEPSTYEIERLRVLFPSLPAILYTKLSAGIAPTLLRLGHVGVRKIVVAWHDDHPRKFRDLLTAEAAQAVSQRLLGELADLLKACPRQLRWAIETMIQEPAEVLTVQALATRARMDRRTCLRWFARAQLPPPSTTLMVLRVVYAHRLLQDPGYTVEDVATKLGYQQTRSFAQSVKEVFGMTPGELRVSLSPDAALAMVRERYFRERLANVS
jgi:AraC-like DNA-binding protein